MQMSDEKLSLSVTEAAKMLGIGRNLMLKLVTVEGFPATRFKRKIIINAAIRNLRTVLL